VTRFHVFVVFDQRKTRKIAKSNRKNKKKLLEKMFFWRRKKRSRGSEGNAGLRRGASSTVLVEVTTDEGSDSDDDVSVSSSSPLQQSSEKDLTISVKDEQQNTENDNDDEDSVSTIGDDNDGVLDEKVLLDFCSLESFEEIEYNSKAPDCLLDVGHVNLEQEKEERMSTQGGVNEKLFVTQNSISNWTPNAPAAESRFSLAKLFGKRTNNNNSGAAASSSGGGAAAPSSKGKSKSKSKSKSKQPHGGPNRWTVVSEMLVAEGAEGAETPSRKSMSKGKGKGKSKSKSEVPASDGNNDESGNAAAAPTSIKGDLVWHVEYCPPAQAYVLGNLVISLEHAKPVAAANASDSGAEAPTAGTGVMASLMNALVQATPQIPAAAESPAVVLQQQQQLDSSSSSDSDSSATATSSSYVSDSDPSSVSMDYYALPPAPLQIADSLSDSSGSGSGSESSESESDDDVAFEAAPQKHQKEKNGQPTKADDAAAAIAAGDDDDASESKIDLLGKGCHYWISVDVESDDSGEQGQRWRNVLKRVDLEPLLRAPMGARDGAACMDRVEASLNLHCVSHRVRVTLHYALAIGSGASAAPLRAVGVHLFGVALRSKRNVRDMARRERLFTSTDFHCALIGAMSSPDSAARFRHLALELLWSVFSAQPDRLRAALPAFDFAATLRACVLQGNAFTMDATVRLLLAAARASSSARRRLLGVTLELIRELVDGAGADSESLAALLSLVVNVSGSGDDRFMATALAGIAQHVRAASARLYENRSALYNVLRAKYALYEFPLSTGVAACSFARSTVASPPVGSDSANRCEQRHLSNTGDALPLNFVSSSPAAAGYKAVRSEDVTNWPFTTVPLYEPVSVTFDLGAPCVVNSLRLQMFPSLFSSTGTVWVETWVAEYDVPEPLMRASIVPKRSGGNAFQSSTIYYALCTATVARFVRISFRLTAGAASNVVRFTASLRGSRNSIEAALGGSLAAAAAATATTTIGADADQAEAAGEVAALREEFALAESKLSAAQEALCRAIEEPDELPTSSSADATEGADGSIHALHAACMDAQLDYALVAARLRFVEPESPMLRGAVEAPKRNDLCRLTGITKLLSKALVTLKRADARRRRRQRRRRRRRGEAVAEHVHVFAGADLLDLFRSFVVFGDVELSRHFMRVVVDELGHGNRLVGFVIDALRRHFTTAALRAGAADGRDLFADQRVFDALAAIATSVNPSRFAHLIHSLYADVEQQYERCVDNAVAADPVLLSWTLLLLSKAIECFDEASTSSLERSTQAGVHIGSRCSGCGLSPIVGARFRCGHCVNVDFCEHCEQQIRSGDAEGETLHSAAHLLVVIPKPLPFTPNDDMLAKFGAVPLLSGVADALAAIVGGDAAPSLAELSPPGTPESQASAAASSSLSLSPSSAAAAPPTPLAQHIVSCEGCGASPIIGTRYHCINCESFELCSQCFGVEPHFAMHHFVKMSRAAAASSTSGSGELHTPTAWIGAPLHPALYPLGQIVLRRSEAKRAKRALQRDVALRQFTRASFERDVQSRGRAGLTMSLDVPRHNAFDDDDAYDYDDPEDPDLTDSDVETESSEGDDAAAQEEEEEDEHSGAAAAAAAALVERASSYQGRPMRTLMSLTVASLGMKTLSDELSILSLLLLKRLAASAQLMDVCRDVIRNAAFTQLLDAALRHPNMFVMSTLLALVDSLRVHRATTAAEQARPLTLMRAHIVSIVTKLLNERSAHMTSAQLCNVLNLLMLVLPTRSALQQLGSAAHLASLAMALSDDDDDDDSAVKKTLHDVKTRAGLLASAPLPATRSSFSSATSPSSRVRYPVSGALLRALLRLLGRYPLADGDAVVHVWSTSLLALLRADPAVLATSKKVRAIVRAGLAASERTQRVLDYEFGQLLSLLVSGGGDESERQVRARDSFRVFALSALAEHWPAARTCDSPQHVDSALVYTRLLRLLIRSLPDVIKSSADAFTDSADVLLRFFGGVRDSLSARPTLGRWLDVSATRAASSSAAPTATTTAASLDDANRSLGALALELVHKVIALNEVARTSLAAHVDAAALRPLVVWLAEHDDDNDAEGGIAGDAALYDDCHAVVLSLLRCIGEHDEASAKRLLEAVRLTLRGANEPTATIAELVCALVGSASLAHYFAIELGGVTLLAGGRKDAAQAAERVPAARDPERVPELAGLLGALQAQIHRTAALSATTPADGGVVDAPLVETRIGSSKRWRNFAPQAEVLLTDSAVAPVRRALTVGVPTMAKPYMMSMANGTNALPSVSMTLRFGQPVQVRQVCAHAVVRAVFGVQMTLAPSVCVVSSGMVRRSLIDVCSAKPTAGTAPLLAASNTGSLRMAELRYDVPADASPQSVWRFEFRSASKEPVALTGVRLFGYDSSMRAELAYDSSARVGADGSGALPLSMLLSAKMMARCFQHENVSAALVRLITAHQAAATAEGKGKGKSKGKVDGVDDNDNDGEGGVPEALRSFDPASLLSTVNGFDMNVSDILWYLAREHEPFADRLLRTILSTASYHTAAHAHLAGKLCAGSMRRIGELSAMVIGALGDKSVATSKSGGNDANRLAPFLLELVAPISAQLRARNTSDDDGKRWLAFFETLLSDDELRALRASLSARSALQHASLRLLSALVQANVANFEVLLDDYMGGHEASAALSSLGELQLSTLAVLGTASRQCTTKMIERGLFSGAAVVAALDAATTSSNRAQLRSLVHFFTVAAHATLVKDLLDERFFEAVVAALVSEKATDEPLAKSVVRLLVVCANRHARNQHAIGVRIYKVIDALSPARMACVLEPLLAAQSSLSVCMHRLSGEPLFGEDEDQSASLVASTSAIHRHVPFSLRLGGSRPGTVTLCAPHALAQASASSKLLRRLASKRQSSVSSPAAAAAWSAQELKLASAAGWRTFVSAPLPCAGTHSIAFVPTKVQSPGYFFVGMTTVEADNSSYLGSVSTAIDFGVHFSGSCLKYFNGTSGAFGRAGLGVTNTLITMTVEFGIGGESAQLTIETAGETFTSEVPKPACIGTWPANFRLAASLYYANDSMVVSNYSLSRGSMSAAQWQATVMRSRSLDVALSGDGDKESSLLQAALAQPLSFHRREPVVNVPLSASLSTLAEGAGCATFTLIGAGSSAATVSSARPVGRIEQLLSADNNNDTGVGLVDLNYASTIASVADDDEQEGKESKEEGAASSSSSAALPSVAATADAEKTQADEFVEATSIAKVFLDSGGLRSVTANLMSKLPKVSSGDSLDVAAKSLVWREWLHLSAFLLSLPAFVTAFASNNKCRTLLIDLAAGRRDVSERGKRAAALSVEVLVPLIESMSASVADQASSPDAALAKVRDEMVNAGLVDEMLGALAYLTSTDARQPALVDDPLAKDRAAVVKKRRDLLAKEGATSSSTPWARGTGYGQGATNSTWNQANFNADQAASMKVCAAIVDFFAAMLSGGGALSPRVRSALSASALVPVAESYLRNDSLLDMMKHADFYNSLLVLIAAMAKHEELLPMLLSSSQSEQVDGAAAASPSTAAAASSSSSSSSAAAAADVSSNIYELLSKLGVTAQLILRGAERIEEMAGQLSQAAASSSSAAAESDVDEAALAKQIFASSNALKAAFETSRARKRGKGKPKNVAGADVSNADGKGKGKGKSKSKSAQTPDEIAGTYCDAVRDLQMGEVSMRKPDGVTYVHHYASRITAASLGSRRKLRRVIQEAASFSSGLPFNIGSSCFVRIDSARVDVMKALITGPEGTPYSGGCFEFHIFCDSSFPTGPPVVNLETTGNGSVRFNPSMSARFVPLFAVARLLTFSN
jgi:Zinc finger, ZZ type/Ubiquitin-conjugating enzyme